MTEMLLDGCGNLLALLFGIGVSAAFLDVAADSKEHCDFERLFCARFYRAVHLVFTAKRLRHICLLSIGDAYAAGAFVYACLQMPPGTFCSGGSHSVPVLSDQQLDLNHTSDIPLP